MTLKLAAQSLNRPYRVRPAMLLLVSLVPFYIVIATLVRERGIAFVPELALDRGIPLVPAWALVYGSLYASLIVPRPEAVIGAGFGAWSLRLLYGADPPFNCFPSIHVAHSFVSAFALGRVHLSTGIAALGAASLVALSTLFTKQHYVLDVGAGIVLAGVAYGIFLRGARRETVPDLDRRLAPVFALVIAALAAAGVIAAWVAYQLGD